MKNLASFATVAALAVLVFVVFPLAPAVAAPRVSGMTNALQQINGQPSYVGTIASTSPTEKDNSNTGTPFTMSSGYAYLIQCDAAAYVLPGTTAATSANGLKLAADDRFLLLFDSSTTKLHVLSASGTANCKVFRVQ